MVRLLDLGFKHLMDIVSDMADLAQKTVRASIRAYEEGGNIDAQVRVWSDTLRAMNDDAEEKTIELIARFQPVASDLRTIKSIMKIAYDLSRFGRYAYDISHIHELVGGPSKESKIVDQMGEKALEMTRISLEAFQKQDPELAKSVLRRDDEIDAMYRTYIREIVKEPLLDIKTIIANILVARHIERIADHACYIADSVLYSITGKHESLPRAI